MTSDDIGYQMCDFLFPYFIPVQNVDACCSASEIGPSLSRPRRAELAYYAHPADTQVPGIWLGFTMWFVLVGQQA